MREAAARPAVFLRDSRTQQARRAGLGPDGTLVHALLVPALQMRRVFVCDEAPRLLFQENEILAHPVRTRDCEHAHARAILGEPVCAVVRAITCIGSLSPGRKVIRHLASTRCPAFM